MPTFRLLPPGAEAASTDDGSDCAALAGAYGLTLDDWQRGVVTDWLRTDAAHHLLATDAVVVLPRQNGKNAVVEATELFKTAVQGRRVLHTAHEVKTARRHFLRMQDYFDNDSYPELKAAVKTIRQTKGRRRDRCGRRVADINQCPATRGAFSFARIEAPCTER